MLEPVQVKLRRDAAQIADILPSPIRAYASVSLQGFARVPPTPYPGQSPSPVIPRIRLVGEAIPNSKPSSEHNLSDEAGFGKAPTPDDKARDSFGNPPGRPGGCPLGLPQIRACPIKAHGSSCYVSLRDGIRSGSRSLAEADNASASDAVEPKAFDDPVGDGIASASIFLWPHSGIVPAHWSYQ